MFKEDGAGKVLTTNQGIRVNDNQNTLKAGERGPSLLEDFHFREKITHFDHERIPERIVHARGSAAHGYFQVYENMSRYTKAGFLQDPSVRTPVFVRFSTVAGSRGSTDLARDVRGFAVKFYTEEGIFDLVGNNIPVFFIQDAIKFPDLVHAVKPEPDNEMPQAASAHDTFWDFISLMPESMHMIMWVMSDRAIPRSFRMMEGFGVHTFRFVDEAGTSRFVKFHWKPLLGMHSVAWDEAQKISGKDPDFLRRDLWEAIEQGNYPGVGARRADRRGGARARLRLRPARSDEDHPGGARPGRADRPADAQPQPRQLLRRDRAGRVPSRARRAGHRLHQRPAAPGPPLLLHRHAAQAARRPELPRDPDQPPDRAGAQQPARRPHAPDDQPREGVLRAELDRRRLPDAGALARRGASRRSPSGSRATKVRARSEKFFDHFSQAALFFNSQSAPEKDHIVEALRFELGKVERLPIRQRMVAMLNLVDEGLAARVAEGLGFREIPTLELPINHSIPADGDPAQFQPRAHRAARRRSLPRCRMANTVKDTVATRKVAILAADGVDTASLQQVKDALERGGAAGKIVAPRLGVLQGRTATSS